MVCGYSRKDITCEIPVVCELVYVDQDCIDEVPFRLIISGYI